MHIKRRDWLRMPWRERMTTMLLGPPCVLLIGYFLWLMLSAPIALGREAERAERLWAHCRMVAGTVISSRTWSTIDTDGRRTGDSVHVTYAFQVDGRRYEAERLLRDDEASPRRMCE